MQTYFIIYCRVEEKGLNIPSMYGHQLEVGGVIHAIGRGILLLHLVYHLYCLQEFSISPQDLR